MTGLYDLVNLAKNEYDAAVRSGNGILSKRAALSNILFNHVDDIMSRMRENTDLLRENDQLRADIKALEAALAESDAELKKAHTAKSKAE